ncbi:unnamed protein product, partial [Amoebophrya sp. A25]
GGGGAAAHGVPSAVSTKYLVRRRVPSAEYNQQKDAAARFWGPPDLESLTAVAPKSQIFSEDAAGPVKNAGDPVPFLWQREISFASPGKVDTGAIGAAFLQSIRGKLQTQGRADGDDTKKKVVYYEIAKFVSYGLSSSDSSGARGTLFKAMQKHTRDYRTALASNAAQSQTPAVDPLTLMKSVTELQFSPVSAAPLRGTSANEKPKGKAKAHGAARQNEQAREQRQSALVLEKEKAPQVDARRMVSRSLGLMEISRGTKLPPLFTLNLVLNAHLPWYLSRGVVPLDRSGFYLRDVGYQTHSLLQKAVLSSGLLVEQEDGLAQGGGGGT